MDVSALPPVPARMDQKMNTAPCLEVLSSKESRDQAFPRRLATYGTVLEDKPLKCFLYMLLHVPLHLA